MRCSLSTFRKDCKVPEQDRKRGNNRSRCRTFSSSSNVNVGSWVSASSLDSLLIAEQKYNFFLSSNKNYLYKTKVSQAIENSSTNNDTLQLSLISSRINDVQTEATANTNSFHCAIHAHKRQLYYKQQF